MKEREISLIDLLFEILLKWRMIVVAMVIGGVLLGGYSYLQSAKTQAIQIEQSKVVITLEDLENELTTTQKSNVKAVIGYENYSEYYENSILMQLDGRNVPTVDLVYAVTTMDNERINEIVETYKSLVATGMTKVLVQSGIAEDEAARISELIRVDNNIMKCDGSKDGFYVSVVNQTVDNGPLCISIVHQDEEKCKALASQVKEFLISQKQVVEEAYGVHNVTLISETYATMTDLDIITQQRAAVIDATSGNVNSDKLKVVFTAQEKKYYDMLKANVVGDETEITVPATVVTVAPTINLKLMILGMVALGALVIAYVLVIYIFNNKLRPTDSITELYDITQLGVVSTLGSKKKFLGFVDTLIIKLRDRNKRKFTKEESEEIVAVAIKMAVRKSGVNEVCLLGCEVKKQTEDVCNNIKVLLEKEDIKVSVLDNILYNAENLEKLENAQNAVLVEKVGSTMYAEVAKEVELLQRNKINVLGGILVE